MENQNTVVAEVENQDTTPIVEENFSAVQDKVNEETSVENQNITEEPSQDSVLADDTSFAKKDDEEDDKKDNEDENKEDKKDEANDDDEEEDTKKKYELLVAAHEELQAKYSELETSYQALVEFKNQVEEKEKDDLIASFVMLSDEDKKEVNKNKSKYSLREIKAELSMICVDKKVSFDLNKEEDNENELPLTYNLNSQETSTLPAWLQAVEDTRKRMK